MKKIIISVFITVLVFSLCGCRGYLPPQTYINAVWESNDPQIMFYTENESDIKGTIEINGQVQSMEASFGPTIFEIGCYEIMEEGGAKLVELYIKGNFKYDGDDIILAIEEDYLFDYKYSEIRMVYQN